jgi:5-methylcytosine-specific restriction endonuclease McrA
MAVAPPRPCPQCHRLYRGRRCGACARREDRARGTAIERGYDAEWGRYSRAWLRRFPFCGQRGDGSFHGEHSFCTREGGRVPATVTDHILSLADGGAMFDPRNHQSLCTSCNTRKGKRVDGRGARVRRPVVVTRRGGGTLA